MKIVLIGSGNTATVLGRRMLQSGHDVIQVLGRNEGTCAELAAELQCPFTVNKEFIDRHADLYVAAVNDSALSLLGKELKLDKKLVVHTAGAVNKEVLKTVSQNYGVLYPLQSLRKELNTVPVIPFLVDGNTADNLTFIKDFAETLSDKVDVAGDEERKKLHLAAVLVNNFTNHLYTLAEEYCREEQLGFDMLVPLIKETAGRIEYLSPSQLQTGPAARGDETTIQMHLELLKNHPQLISLYQLLTDSIQTRKG